MPIKGHLKNECMNHPYQYKRCGLKDLYVVTTHSHNKECTKKITCSECNETILQGEKARHLSEVSSYY